MNLCLLTLKQIGLRTAQWKNLFSVELSELHANFLDDVLAVSYGIRES